MSSCNNDNRPKLKWNWHNNALYLEYWIEMRTNLLKDIFEFFSDGSLTEFEKKLVCVQQS